MSQADILAGRMNRTRSTPEGFRQYRLPIHWRAEGRPNIAKGFSPGDRRADIISEVLKPSFRSDGRGFRHSPGVRIGRGVGAKHSHQISRNRDPSCECFAPTTLRDNRAWVLCRGPFDRMPGAGFAPGSDG